MGKRNPSELLFAFRCTSAASQGAAAQARSRHCSSGSSDVLIELIFQITPPSSIEDSACLQYPATLQAPPCAGQQKCQMRIQPAEGILAMASEKLCTMATSELKASVSLLRGCCISSTAVTTNCEKVAH